MGDGGVEVNALEERVDLNASVGGGRKVALGTLAGSAQTTHGTGVAGHVLLVLALELLHEVVDETVVKVLTTKVSVTGGRLHLEDAVVNGEKGHVEGATTQVEDEHVGLAGRLLVETVGDGRSSGLVDTSDGTGILGGLTLRVVKVGWHGHHDILDVLASESLSSLLHLGEHHRGDLLGGESLLLTLEGHLNLGDVAIAGLDLEWPVLHV